MPELTRGANSELAGRDVTVAVAGAEQGTVDLMVFQLTGDHRVRSDADFVFFNQPASPEGAVRLAAADSVTAALDAVPSDIETLAVAVALDDTVPGSLAGRPGLGVTVSAGGSAITAAADGLTDERAAVLVELYRRGDAWKVRNVSAGWAAGLHGLATEFGVDVGEPAPPAAAAAPAAPPTPPPPAAAPPTPPPPAAASAAAPPAGMPPPTTPPPPDQPPLPPGAAPAAAPPPPPPPPPSAAAPAIVPAGQKVDLGKRTGRVDLVKGQRVAIDGSDLIVASISWPPQTDYDVYALIRYADGRTETVATFGTDKDKNFTMQSSDGAVRHCGDVRRAEQPQLSRKERKALKQQGQPEPQASTEPAVERIEIRPHAGLLAIVPVAYSAQSNGTGSFRRYQVSMAIDNGHGTTVQIAAPNADDDDHVYSCVPGIITITPQGVVIDSLEQYSRPSSERRPVLEPDLRVTMDAGPTNDFK